MARGRHHWLSGPRSCSVGNEVFVGFNSLRLKRTVRATSKPAETTSKRENE